MVYIRDIISGVAKGPYFLFCVAFGGFWCWNWIVFQSPTSLPIPIGNTGLVLPCRSISLAVFALSSFVVYAVRHRRKAKAHAGVPGWIRMIVLLGAVSVIVVCDVADGSFDGISESLVSSLLAGCAFGVVGAAFYLAWATFVAKVGFARFRLMILACVVSSMAGSLFAFLFHYVPDSVRQVFVLAFLVASFPLLGHFGKRQLFGIDPESTYRPVPADAKIPKKFVITLLILGVALGLMQSIFTLINTLTLLGPLSSVGFAAAALLVAATVFVFDFDFNRLLYQVGFPLMAFGFLLLLAFGNGFWGYLLSVTGYRFCEIVMWVLCIYLIARIRGAETYLFPLPACLLALGQAVGLLTFDGRFESHLMQISLAAVTVLFMGALLLVTSKGTKESWGIVTPGERPLSRNTDEALSDIAVDAMFTSRENEVFALLAQGKNKRAISKDLVLSENTVKTHIAKIYQKLGIHSQQELIELVDGRASAMSKDDAPSSIGEER